jgi:hypothetical protein
VSRNFDLATGPNYSINSVGSCGAVGNGAYTIIALFNVNAGNNNCGLISFRSAGINAELFIDTNQIFGANDFNGGQTGVTVSTWWWAAIRKAAGTNVYRYSLRQYNTGSTTHQNSVATHADSGVSNTSIRLGDSDDRSNGLVAVWAAWTSNLSDGQVAGMFTTAAADVAAQSPQGLWLGNQASSSDPINDSAGSANQTSVNGSIGVGTDPPSYSYSLGAAQSAARSPLVVSAPIQVTPGQQTLVRNTAALIVPPAKGVAPIVVTGPVSVPAAAAILVRNPAPAVAAPVTSTPSPYVVTAPVPAPASVALLLRGSLADAPVLTTASPMVVTAPASSPRPAAILVRPLPADAATPGPIVVTAAVPAAPAAAILVRNPQAPVVQTPATTPGPIVVTSTAAAPTAEVLLIRGSLADAPVLTTGSPLVVTRPVRAAPAAVWLIRNPPPGVPPVSGPTTKPIVVTAVRPAPPGLTVLIRGTGIACDCTTHRPNLGTTTRPSSGITARPGAGTTTRPSSGITTRPDSGTTSRPCSCND